MSEILEVEAPFKVRFERITPERATALLATQPDTGAAKNRSLSRGRVVRYADDMDAGFWEPTHQGIAVDENGILMDGQHRLEAVVASGKSVTMMVCEGVSRDTFWLMDGGFARSAQSFLNGKYAIQRSALARTLMRLEECDGTASLDKIGNGQYPSHRILRFLEDRSDVREYGEAFSFAAVAATNRTKGHFTGTSTVGLLVGGYVAEMADKGTEWWEDVHAIKEGNGLEDGNPVKALWKATPVGGNMTNVNYMRAIYAGVKYRDGQSLKMLRSHAYRTVAVW